MISTEAIDAMSTLLAADPWQRPTPFQICSVPDYASDFAAFFDGDCEEAELVTTPMQSDEQREAIRRAWYVLQRDTPSDPRVTVLAIQMIEGGRRSWM